MRNYLLIRHGKTQGNLERRYISHSDEPICDIGRKETELLAEKNSFHSITRVYSSPALRCLQTAEILFPDTKPVICSGMKEIDFGIFTNRTADEMENCKAYREWVDTGCMGDIPGGDCVQEYKDRCCGLFEEISEEDFDGVIALVIHGGNIMSILERFAKPKKDFYSYHIPNSGFVLCNFENDGLHILQKGECGE